MVPVEKGILIVAFMIVNLLFFTWPLYFLFLGLQHEGIFRVSGSQVEVNDIKNAFERGEVEINSYKINVC
jgi:hypothetical protein